ncbi:MAG: hypothetical protein IPL33_15350 [Sphingobacteriales bacterium]|nr:hypothetical protein [Sphingobacteriales bacterium]
MAASEQALCPKHFGTYQPICRVTAMTTNSVTVSSASGFAIGDLVLLVQMDGDLNTAAGADQATTSSISFRAL